MSESSWRNGLALGLTSGFGLGVIFVLFLEYYSPTIDRNTSADTYCAAQDYQCQNDQDSGPDRGYFFRRLISTEDTLAQWIMMVFTIAASWLLYLTLSASRSIAMDAREIGQAQVRAYVSWRSVGLQITHSADAGDHRIEIVVKGTLHNTGQTPAYQVISSTHIGVVTKAAVGRFEGNELFEASANQFDTVQSGCGVNRKTTVLRWADMGQVNSGIFVVRVVVRYTCVDIFGITQAGVVAGYYIDFLDIEEGAKFVFITPP